MRSSNDQPLRHGPDSVSHEAMKTIGAERCDSFEARQRHQESNQPDAEDLKAIEDLEKDLKRRRAKWEKETGPLQGNAALRNKNLNQGFALRVQEDQRHGGDAASAFHRSDNFPQERPGV